MKIKWLDKPHKNNYPDAVSYLSLTLSRKAAKAAVADLKKADLSEFAAKDIFRASGLSLLGISNTHVERDRELITRGENLSPLLLYRDERNGRVIIADGYHRLCAVYKFDEDARIPCKIV